MVRKRWKLLKSGEGSRAQAQELAEALGVSALATLLALERGVAAEELPEFLGLEERPLVSPFELPDLDVAAACVEDAIDKGELITVFGDYDCDGVTATALLFQYLSGRTERVSYHIPDRKTEGYGLTTEAIDELHRAGTKLIVTVDNGVSALKEIAHAIALGMRVVVTDHHQVGTELPVCSALVNPQRSDCTLSFKDYTGVALAFLLVCALEGMEPSELLPDWGDLVALGTVADVAPLQFDNRAFVRGGLRVLEESPSIGFEALLRQVQTRKRAFNAATLGFSLGPRINAAGRMGHAEEALKLLLAQEESVAEQLAGQLELYNEERQTVEREILAAALQWLEAHPERAADPVMVFAGAGWHEGVVGIVASRLVEQLGKPCLMLSIRDETATGSGRSIPGFHLFQAIDHSGHLLQKYGGHELAAGFTLPTDAIETFREELNAYALALPELPFPLRVLDAKLNAAALTPELVEELSLLEPFGQGNPQPVFALMNVALSAVTPVSDGRHLRLSLKQGTQMVTCMAFHTTAESFAFRPGDVVDLAVTLDINEYQGARSVTLILKGAKFSVLSNEEVLKAQRLVEAVQRRGVFPQEEAERLCPTREDGAKAFRHLAGGAVPPERLFLVEEFGPVEPEQRVAQYVRLWLALEVLCGFGLVRRTSYGFYERTQSHEKQDWEQAELVQFLKKI